MAWLQDEDISSVKASRQMQIVWVECVEEGAQSASIATPEDEESVKTRLCACVCVCVCPCVCSCMSVCVCIESREVYK